MKSIVLALLGLVLALAPAAFAQPDIQSVEGTVADGETVTIRGVQFGTKSPAAPIKFESFETAGAVDGQRVNALQPEWIDPGDPDGAHYESDYAHTGQFSASNASPSPWVAHENFKTNYFDTGLQEQLYCSYWWRYNGGSTSDYSMNIKLARLNSLSGAGNWYNGVGSTTVNNCSPSEPTPGGDCDYTTGTGNYDIVRENLGEIEMNVDLNAWNRIDIHKSLSTPGVADGHIFCWNVSLGDYDIDKTSLITRAASDDFQLDLVALPLMWANQYDTSARFSLCVDDVYIDNTLARIELGDNPDFRSCRHREMQLPVTWNAEGTVLTAQIRQGTLPNGEAWLFVVDADGEASEGFSVTFGQEQEIAPIPEGTRWR